MEGCARWAALSMALSMGGLAKGGGPVDFDRLGGELTRKGAGWSLAIDFEVDLDTRLANSSAPPVLRVTLSECGRPVVGADGKPVEAVFVLNRPFEVKRHEREFADRARVSAPHASVCKPEGLKLLAVVTDASGRTIHGRREAGVRFRDPDARRPALGFGVGVGIGPVILGPWIGF